MSALVIITISVEVCPVELGRGYDLCRIEARTQAPGLVVTGTGRGTGRSPGRRRLLLSKKSVNNLGNLIREMLIKFKIPSLF